MTNCRMILKSVPYRVARAADSTLRNHAEEDSSDRSNERAHPVACSVSKVEAEKPTQAYLS
jgi:hypothetical protein